MQKVRRQSGKPLLRLIVSVQFQDLFHSPIRGSFHLSLAVLVHYRSQKVLRLGGWSPHIQAGFHVSRLTRLQNFYICLQDYHLLLLVFPYYSTSSKFHKWPDPISLATTFGVSIDFLSYGY